MCLFLAQNETVIAEKLMQIGPLSIALNAALLQFYHKGVFEPRHCDPANLDHGKLNTFCKYQNLTCCKNVLCGDHCRLQAQYELCKCIASYIL